MVDDVPRLSEAVELSVVVPIFEEEESIPLLVEMLVSELDKIGRSYEIVAVNDGSRDSSQTVLAEAAARYPQLRVVEFRINAGQTAALMAGIDNSRGEIIVTIDADLQNDPSDIHLMLDKLDEGFDVVSGWRKDRQDAAIKRNLVSRIANRVISSISGVKLHDYGCTLKVYRREVLEGMRLYGEMHRFVPIYASWMGAKVVEMPGRHHARKFGRSKYGLNRIFKVILDLIVIKFFSQYLVKPIYVFGGAAALFMLGSIASLIFMLWMKIVEGIPMILTPMPVLSAMLFLLAVMTILLGILAEILVRTYFESQGRHAYHVRGTINMDRKP